MRVIVEAVSGPGKGRQLTLKPGDVIVVGRTEWSDVCIGADQQMSARHFAIESGSDGVRLIDQGSTNGTQVNGEFVKEAPLYEGDQIVAGTTAFQVRIEQSTTAVPPGTTPASPATNPFGESNPSPYAPVEIGGAGPLGPPDMMKAGGNPFDDKVVYTGDASVPNQPPLPRENPIYWEEGPTAVEPQSQPTNPPGSVPPNVGSGSGPDSYDSPVVMDSGPAGGREAPSALAGSPTETPFGNDTPFGAGPTPSEIPGGVPQSSETPPAPMPNSPFGDTPPSEGAPGAGAPNPASSAPAEVEQSSVPAPASNTPTPPPPPPGYGDGPIQPTTSEPPSAQSPAAGAAAANIPPRSDFVAATPSDGPTPRTLPVYDTSRNVTPATPDMLQYSVTPCRSALIKCLRSNFGDAPIEFKPSSIMAQMQRQNHLITLFHFQKGGLEFPDELTDAIPLLHWLPEETAKNFGPVLVAQTNQLDRLATVDALWDADAAVCIYTRDVEGATKHLRELLKYNMNGGEDEEGIFGYCWPSVIGSLLECQEDEVVEVIFGDMIDFIFVEVVGQPGQWQIFTRQQYAPSFDKSGFREVPLEDSSPTP